MNDKRSNAYELLVDDLMSRPAYGERWARVWLDLARYADSAGYGSIRYAHLEISRLGDRGVQSKHAVRPVHHRAVGR